MLPPPPRAAAPVTNAKGCFSQSLAEFTLMGCMYFDKDVPRLQANRVAYGLFCGTRHECDFESD